LAVRIRLTRVGATKRPAYRVIAIDKRRSRDGRALEILGFYDPLTEPATVNIDTEKINAWIGKGAQPSETVAKLMRQAARAPEQTAEKPKRATRPTKPKPSKKAAAKAATADAPTDAVATREDAPAADAAAEDAADPVVADDAPAADEAQTPAPEASAPPEDADASTEKADA
jgi:small subunit ribosomal protein S16